MLNIEDIKRFHRDFPEPMEIRLMRENLVKSFVGLRFDPEPHKYFVDEDGGSVELPSVSKVIKDFENKKDWDGIASRYARKNGMTVDQVKRMWKENNIRSTNNGTSVHLFLESYMHFFLGHPEKIDPVILPQYEDGFLIPLNQKQEAGMKYYESLYNSFYDDSVKIKVYPVMPELQMYIFKDNKFGIQRRYAGTMDILLAYQDPTDGKYKLICDDWKTNASLYNDYARNMGEFMLPPFESYIDESFSHYTAQLSSYTITLRQLGYQVPARNIVWLKDDATFERIPVNDLSNSLITTFGGNPNA